MKNIGIIGVGNIGSSLARLIIRNGYGNKLSLSDNTKEPWLISNEKNIKTSDILFIAVKPNDMADVLKDIRKHSDHEDKLIISTAASVPISYMEKQLESENYPIVRIMPNYPINIGAGVITYYANNNVHQNNISALSNLLDGPYLYPVKNEGQTCRSF